MIPCWRVNNRESDKHLNNFLHEQFRNMKNVFVNFCVLNGLMREAHEFSIDSMIQGHHECMLMFC